MDELRGERVRAALVYGVLLVAGLALGGWLLGGQIKDLKLGDRYVTVRGLTERKVKADVAIWSLNFKESGDDLAATYEKSEKDKATVLAFITSHGISGPDVSVGAASVNDRQANEYGNNAKGPRYIVQQTVTVQTGKVDAVSAAAQHASELVQQGLVLSNAGGGGPEYNFTGLNGIKPDMITEATKNARTAADRFAADSGSKVGTIRRAEQGVFSISNADGDSVAEDGGGGAGMGQSHADGVMKKVRVVTTVDYYLER